MVGAPEHAEALLAEGARLYPGFSELRNYRFDREAYSGSPDRALALLHDPATAPMRDAPYLAAAELLEKARKSGLATDADAAMASLYEAVEHNPLDKARVLFPMALGRLDEAFRAPDLSMFEGPVAGEPMWGAADRLRRDPRFWPVAARAGYVRYWLTTNKWPDFCSDPSYPLDCRAEAKRVVVLNPAD
jgi:hypothetical protein